MGVLRRGDRGPEVTRLEVALQETGHYSGVIDDDFGGRLEGAVIAYQRERGLPATGVADEETRRRILAEPSPRAVALRDKPSDFRALALTAGFETGASVPDCFAGLAGNFDGQGISFGVLQWNLGQGTLQPLLKKLNQKHPSIVRGAFGNGYQPLLEMLHQPLSRQLAWAESIQTATRRTLMEPWRSRFSALGRTPECQQVQLEGARQRFETAARMSADYGLWSARGLALMFDIVVQNGSIGSATRDRIMAEFAALPGDLSREGLESAKMTIIANRRAEASRAEFVEDVRRRKLAIATGTGIVHGIGYDLDRQYLLTLVEHVPLPLAR